MPKFISTSSHKTRPVPILRFGSIIALVLVALGLYSHSQTFAFLHQSPNGYSAPPEGPTISSFCPDGIPAVDDMLQPINITDNIREDFAEWGDGTFTLQDIMNTRQSFTRNDVTFLIQIKDNIIKFLDRDDDCAENCHGIIHSIKQAWQWGIDNRVISFPDVTFLLNIEDHAMCRRPSIVKFHPGIKNCTAPMLSINRRKDTYLDILVPNFHPGFQVYSLPWSEKKPIAFFRGSPFCNEIDHMIAGRRVNCSRLILSDLTKQHPNLLNVSITSDFDYQGRLWKALKGPETPPSDHANYQMLLNLDGYSASSRFGMLLATNSIVLKQESPYQEYYYRSIKPCVHYLPIWYEDEEDVLTIIQMVRNDPINAQKIAANGQAFALLNLSHEAKLNYWVRVLEEYAARTRQ